MGNGQGWISPPPKKKEGSALKEIRIGHIKDAHEIVGLLVEDWTPVSLVPESAAIECCCCKCCCVAIPDGFSAMVTRWGKAVDGDNEDKTWNGGFHCWLPWYKVSRLVSQQSIVFDTPVRYCKTKDDISVNVDVMIDFAITNAPDFVYNIGPEKLDDLLRATQEEVLRNMVGDIPVANIYDLYGRNTKEWVDKMNQTFSNFGVEVRHFTIKNVEIPPTMAQDLEDKTLFESKTLETAMQQETELLKLNHEEARQKLREECQNAMMAKEEQMVTAKAQITAEVAELVTTGEKEIALKRVRCKEAVEDVTTSSMLECARLEADMMEVRRDIQCQMDLDVGKLQAEALFYENKKKAVTKMEAAEKTAEGNKAIAEAEGAAAEAFSHRRAQEQEMARLSILEALADNRNIKIATSLENNTGLAPDNSLVAQVAQQGLEAFRMKLAKMTGDSAGALDMGSRYAGGLVRPVPQQQM